DELIPPAVELIAQGVAEAAVDAGYAVVSGGAKGIDQVSMRAAYNAGGDSIGFLAESLVKQVRKQGPAAFEDGLVCLATCYAPDAPFSVGNAMGRNKLVYGHATATVVVSAARGSGGAGGGAVEAIGRGLPVLVRSGPRVPEGNVELLKRGGGSLDPTLALPRPLTRPEELLELIDEIHTELPGA
ncbi:MAG: DNA-processing protein DprA, partial [Armatimonadota bacterium]